MTVKSHTPRHGAPILTALVGVFLLVFGAGLVSAQAQTEGANYWSLWGGELDGTWSAFQQGAADTEVGEEAVIAAKYLKSTDQLTQENAPETKPNYQALCPGTQPQEGRVRVAVVLDFGDPSLAPEGQTPPGNEVDCVAVPEPATAMVAFSDAASVGILSNGFIVSIDGYPNDAQADSTPTVGLPVNEEEGFDYGPFMLVGTVLFLMLWAWIVYAYQRRRSAGKHEQ